MDVLTPPSPQSQSTTSCGNGSRRLSTGGCAPSPTTKVTPSPITPPPVSGVCASITNKRSCKKSMSGCKWEKSSQTCYMMSGDSKSGKGGKRGKSSKKLFE